MAGIVPVSGITTQIASGAASAVRQGESSGVAKAGESAQGAFGSVLKSAVENVSDAQQQAVQSVGDLMAGREDNFLPAVSAMAKADLSFKLLLGVRNKVIDAYKQTMNMQV